MKKKKRKYLRFIKKHLEDDMIEQIGEIIGTALAWVIAIASVAIGGALGLGIGRVILVYFGVL